MGRRCTVCAHPRVAEIDRAVVGGEPYRTTARRFKLGRDAVRRHVNAGHVTRAIAAAGEAAEVARGDDLLQRLRDLDSRSTAILDQAETAGDLRSALGAIRELRSLVELWAKLVGELQPDGATVVINSPEWVSLRGQILVALDPFPEARAAVIGALDSDGS